LIDCRYPFEYQGGHIKSAQNITTVDVIEKMFFKYPQSKKIVIVFHCEYSIQRAPQMYFLLTRCLHFRSTDRNMNQLDYPKLFYPDIYILKGGYREFFQNEKVLVILIGFL
jgi:rhodanese-related sulfurtransferase